MTLRVLAPSERAFIARRRLRHAPRPEIASIVARLARKSTVASVLAPYVSLEATPRRCVQTSLALVIAGSLLTPVTSFAQTPDEGILQAAERATVGMELQADASGRRRSPIRTGVGIGMVAAGVGLATAQGCYVSIDTDCVREPAWYERVPGVAVAAGGVLLATVWSDVEALSSVDVAVAPDRVHVGKTWGF